MGDERRAALLAELASAKALEASIRDRLESHRLNILEVRLALGNPYFYSSRPADDPKSEARFTSYASRDPALALLREWRQAAHQVALIQRQLSG